MEKDDNNGKKKVKIDPRQARNTSLLFFALKDFIQQTLNIKDGVDIEGTIDSIKKDIDFRGPNVWILISSIFIASIGLNLNSVAAIIGAMLISPLMGPILGIGLSVGTNDLPTLARSLKSLGVAVGVSILTSYIYFSITPLQEIQSEILARTRPTLLDAIIAIFGGIAGIIAGSRKEKSNVVPGVAIATALMPPLCTAGFGLATHNYPFFLGAFYLFFLNSVFIAIPTIFIVRYLKFPIKHFIDEKKERLVRRSIFLFVLLGILPSAYIFYQVIRESAFKNKASQFISENVHYDYCEIIDTKIFYNPDTLSVIELFMFGDPIPDVDKSELNQKLAGFGLPNTQVRIFQSEDRNEIDLVGMQQRLRVGVLEDLYKKNEQQLKSKDEKIKFLEDQLLTYQQDSIPFNSIINELKVMYDQIEGVGYANALESNLMQTDTIPTFLIKWSRKTNSYRRRQADAKISEWLMVRLKMDTVRIFDY